MNGYEESRMKPLNTQGEFLNLAAFVPETRSLGPGIRAALWVQGCPFSCPGCISPEWIPIKTRHLVPVEKIAIEILKHKNVSGLTISGGEPMLQSQPLERLISFLRNEREFDVICFTGFYVEDVQRSTVPSIIKLLNSLDVLVDGPFIIDLNNNQGLRGSSNQRIIHFTDKLKSFDLERWPRQIEVNITNQSMMVIGIPTIEGLRALNKTYKGLRANPGGSDEWS